MRTASGGTKVFIVINRRILLYDALSIFNETSVEGYFLASTKRFSTMLAYVSSPVNHSRCDSRVRLFVSDTSLSRCNAEAFAESIFNLTEIKLSEFKAIVCFW